MGHVGRKLFFALDGLLDFIKHFIKDMTIATEEAKDVNLNMNIVNNVLSMYQSLDKEGYGEFGTQALIKYYQK